MKICSAIGGFTLERKYNKSNVNIYIRMSESGRRQDIIFIKGKFYES